MIRKLPNVVYQISDVYTKYTPKMNIEDQLSHVPILQHAIPLFFSVIYYLFVKYFPAIQKEKRYFLKNKKALKYTIFTWNILLSTYSAIVFLYTVTDSLIQLEVNNWRWFPLLCASDCIYFRDGRPSVFWGNTFTLSKFFELIDTVFLIIKKPERKVAFLHWYHHLTVMNLTWYGSVSSLGVAEFVIFMNSGIHFVMYFYYALVTIGIRPPKIMSFFLTALQTTQMLLGVMAINIWCYGYFAGFGCCSNEWGKWVMVPMTAFVYASYFYLFAKFMRRRYFGKKEKKKKKIKDKQN